MVQPFGGAQFDVRGAVRRYQSLAPTSSSGVLKTHLADYASQVAIQRLATDILTSARGSECEPQYIVVPATVTR